MPLIIYVGGYEISCRAQIQFRYLLGTGTGNIVGICKFVTRLRSRDLDRVSKLQDGSFLSLKTLR